MNKGNFRRLLGRASRKLAPFSIVIALALLPTLFAPQPAAAQGTAIVRCDPLGTITGQVGEQFNVDLYVQDVTNLYGLQLRIDFDPTIVQAVDMDAIFPGVQILPLVNFLVPGFIVEREANNITGVVEYSMTQLDPQPPANGSGGVARIVFQPLKAGSFTMNWDDSYVLLSGPAGVPIPSTTTDCNITVQGDPTTITLNVLDVSGRETQNWRLGGVLVSLTLATAIVWLRASRRSAHRTSL
jgi:hypothetical protein